MGFYPLNPASAEYVIGSPLFTRATSTTCCAAVDASDHLILLKENKFLPTGNSSIDTVSISSDRSLLPEPPYGHTD
jgi:hypothetical protein